MTRATHRNYWSALVAFLLAAALVVAPPHQTARAAVLFVDQNAVGCSGGGGAPFCTIGEAVSVAASSGDTIEVAPGIYVEAVFVGSKVVTIRSTLGAGVTTIQAPAPDTTVVTVNIGNLTLEGFTLTGANIPSFANGGGAFVNNSSGTLTVVDSVITGNSTAARGGGIESFGALTVINSLITGNSSLNGGGIFNSGTATVIDSIITGNTATVGGGIYNATFGTPTLQVTNSTISNNVAQRGGAISNETGTIAVDQSLIAGNTAPSGAGVWVDGPDLGGNEAELVNTTIVNNIGPGIQVSAAGANAHLYFSTAAGNGIGVVGGGANSVVLARSLVADNTTDCAGTIGMAAYNLVGVQDGGCTLTSVGTGDQVGTPGAPIDPLLGSLADNGGPTQTLALLPGSPAIDAAILLACAAVDQRGMVRPQGDLCDIGAFEAAPTVGPLQSLIDAAGPGAVIPVPAGTYNENITIGDGKTLDGAGIGATIIDGGGVETTVRLVGDAAFEDLTITGGFADDGSITGGGGGGIHVDGDGFGDIFDLTLNRVEVTGNDADVGAGIYANSANVTINDSEITANDSAGDGGGFIILNSPGAAIAGTEFSTNSALGFGGAFYANSTNVVTITDSVFTGNSAGVYGGAALLLGPDITVTGSNFTNNSADIGGAIYNDFNLLVDTSTFALNTATVTGGAIHSDSDTSLIDSTVDLNTAPVGGGIYANVGSLTVSGSTISNNSATTATGTTGGGIGVGSATVDISNSTLSGNQSASNGGGLGLTGGTAVLNNVTLADNFAADSGAAFNGDPASTIYISNSLSAGNTNGAGGPNCASLVSLGHNILGGNPGGCDLRPTDIIGPGLIGPLADNGGPTLTHALAPASPAIDAGRAPLAYDVFDGTTLPDWQLNGFTDTDAGELLLAAPDPSAFNVGSAFVTDTIAVDQDFAAQFDFQIVPDTSGGADGLTFTISDDPAVLGQGGGLLGIAIYDPADPGAIGVVNGVSVEFDTWVNGAAEEANDPNGNHIGIDVDGSLSSVALTSMAPANLSDGSVWTAWIDYDATTNTLEVRASNTGSRPVAATVSAVVDIASLAGPNAYVGFTGASGNPPISGEQRVLNFTFDAGGVCETTDQRGVARPQGPTCDIGAFEAPYVPALETEIQVAVVNDNGVGAGSQIIPINEGSTDLYLSVVGGPAASQLGAIQLGAIQLGAIQLGAIQLGAIGEQAPLGYLDLSTLISASAEIEAAQLGAIGPVDQILLVDIPIPGGWESILALSPALAGRPSYTVTLAEALADPAVAAAVEPLRLFESGITASQLGAIPLEVYALGAVQLGAIQLGAIQLGAIDLIMDDLCAQIDCASYSIDPEVPSTYEGYSLMSLSLLGADLSPLQLGAIQLGAIDLTGVQLGAIQLGAIDLAASQLGAIQLGAIQLGAIQLGAIQLGAIGDHPAADAAGLDANSDNQLSTDEIEDYWCSAAGGLDCGPLPKDNAGAPDLSGYSIVALAAMGADIDVLQLGAIQLGAIQLGAIEVNGSQLGAIQLGAIDIENSQLGAIDLQDTQLGAIQLGAIQLGAIDVLDAQLGAIQLGAIQLGAIDLTASQLGAIQLGAIQLGAIQLGAIDAIFNCSALPGGCEAHPELTLAEAAALGVLRPAATIGDLEGAFGDLTLNDLAAAGIDLTAIVGTISDLLPEATVAQLPPDLTLEDIKELVGVTTLLELLIALMDPVNLAWQDLDPAELTVETPLSAQGMSANFRVIADPLVEPGAALPFTAEVQVEIPAGVQVGDSFEIIKNPLVLPAVGEPLSAPVIDGSTYTWVIEGIEANTDYKVNFDIATLLTADESQPLSAQVTALGVTGDALFAVTVVENEENDTFGSAVSITEPSLALGLVDSASDVDLYQVQVGANGQISAYLNTGGVDLDLVLFEPADATNLPLRSDPEQVVDGSLDPILGSTDEQDQESLADIANTGLAPVYKASLHRGADGEAIVTPPLATPGTYYVQVTGYNGATNVPTPANPDATPYSLYLQVIDQENRGACTPRSFTGGVPLATTPLPAVGDLPPGVETLFIINEARFAATHGPNALADVQAALTELLTDGTMPGYTAPNGAVLAVDGAPTVATAYADWDADRCNPAAANDVVDAIADLVDTYRAVNPTITSIVLVGSDDLVPHGRVRDNTTIANEREYANEFSGNNELVGSLASGMVLTDDPYVDANPLLVPQGNREVFIPTIAVGRLVESPLEIVAALDQYVVSGGFLAIADSSTATIFGYDFLADMAAAVAAELVGFTVDLLNNETWTDSDWTTAVAPGAALISSNAHYDHDEGLPALSNSGASAALFDLDDLPLSLTGSIIYSVGCHSGLNAPASYLDQNDDLADWAQALLARDAVYVANTGFGYGDDTFVGYSEALMLEMTENFADVNTIGEALMFAKQQRALDTFAWSPYDDKALMESTLYGLPFYKLHPSPVPPPQPPAPIPTTVDNDTGLDTSSIDSSAVPSLPAPVSTDEGEYIPTDTLIQVPFRPVQPADSFDVTATGLVARGAVVESLSSSDTAGVDAVYARALLYDADLEPEVETEGPFPTVLSQIRRGSNLFGERDLLILARGRYFPDTQTQRTFDTMEATVYYVAPGDDGDITPPQIALSSAVEVGGTISFDVTASDPESGISRVLVLYKEAGAQGLWSSLDLDAGTGNRWAGTAPALGNDVVYWVQVLSGTGLLSFSSDKGNLHLVEQPGPPTVDFSEPGANGWIVGAATFSATSPENAPGVGLEYSVDGGVFTDYNNAPVPLDEGTSVLRVRPEGVTVPESTTIAAVQVDTTAPTVDITTLPDLVVGQGSSLPLEYTCDDTTSGISSCAGPVPNGASVDTSTVGAFTVAVQAVDLAGNAATGELTYEVVAHSGASTLVIDTPVQKVGEPVFATLVVSGDDGHSVVWDWGDGGAVDPDTHTYTAAGVYTVTVTVTHDALNVPEVVSAFAVVYDPSEGFVTGGGWIDSPSGAYTPGDPGDPDIVGRAEFGFVSKYKKGQTVPTGNTAFEFEAGALDFSSTSYDWLVVQGGGKAAFKGVGVIEGTPGEFKFRVTIWDADVEDNDAFEVDRFRIQIWTELGDGSDYFLYDNGYGIDPDADPQGGATELGGGSIKIHVPKKGGKK